MSDRLRDGVVKRGRTWTYVIRASDPMTGRTRPVWVGGYATEDAAKAARDRARVASRRGEYVGRSSMTVEAYLRRWLVAYEVAVKPATLACYRHGLEHYVIPRIGHIRLQAIQPATITILYRELLECGGQAGGPLSPATVNHVHRVLRKALNDAVYVYRLLYSNPAQPATRPQAQPDKQFDLWTADELRRFLEVASDHRLGAFYRLAAYTGARRGELLNLSWRDLNLDAAELTISGSASTVEGRRVSGTTKNGRSRTVTLDIGTVEAMRQHCERQRRERQASRRWWEDDGDLIFRREDGQPLHTDTPSCLMPDLVAVAGVRPARLHDLRHIHASTLLLAGVPIPVVAARLGHTHPAITLRVYAHFIGNEAIGGADAFAAAVASYETPPRTQISTQTD
jgi:integrase